MKTLDLLRCLTKKERKEFDFVMKNHRRISLRRLHIFLQSFIKKDTNPSKSVLFEAAFEVEFTSNKDYKLRHELRLLNDELMHFLIKQSFENQLKDNPHFYHAWEMKVLKNRKLDKHIETAYKQYFEKAQAALQPQYAQEILSAYITHLIASKEIRLELYKNIEGLLEEKSNLLQQQFWHEHLEIHVKQAFATRVIRIMEPDYPKPILKEAISLEGKKDVFAHILQLEADSYSQRGLEKIATLNQLLEQLETCPYPWLQYNRRKMVTLSNMALTYYLLGNNDRSQHFYERIMEHARDSKEAVPIEVLFNYFSNLVKMKQYTTALAVYTENAKMIQQYSKVTYRFLCLKAMCYIGLKQTDAVLQSVPSNIRQLPSDQYYYFRFIQLILHYQMDDWEGGLRETENFLKVLNYVKNPHFDVDYKQLAYFYLQFFKAILDVPTAQKKTLKELNLILLECKNHPTERNNHLLLEWLEEVVVEWLSCC